MTFATRHGGLIESAAAVASTLSVKRFLSVATVLGTANAGSHGVRSSQASECRLRLLLRRRYSSYS